MPYSPVAQTAQLGVAFVASLPKPRPLNHVLSALVLESTPGEEDPPTTYTTSHDPHTREVALPLPGNGGSRRTATDASSVRVRRRQRLYRLRREARPAKSTSWLAGEPAVTVHRLSDLRSEEAQKLQSRDNELRAEQTVTGQDGESDRRLLGYSERATGVSSDTQRERQAPPRMLRERRRAQHSDSETTESILLLTAPKAFKSRAFCCMRRLRV